MTAGVFITSAPTCQWRTSSNSPVPRPRILLSCRPLPPAPPALRGKRSGKSSPACRMSAFLPGARAPRCASCSTGQGRCPGSGPPAENARRQDEAQCDRLYTAIAEKIFPESLAPLALGPGFYCTACFSCPICQYCVAGILRGAIMQTGTSYSDVHWRRFEHPVFFWLGAAACMTGVILHIPMYYSARSMGYQMVGMQPDAAMIIGMVLIGAGLIAAFYGLLPSQTRRIGEKAARIQVRALDDARIRPQHVVLLVIVSLAIVIDAMKPAALSFVAPGMAKEYGLKAATNPHGGLPVSLLPLCGIGGTVLGSLLWGWLPAPP